MNNPSISVHHNPAALRFEARVEGYLCVADYHMNANVMEMTYTFVDPALQGRGIGTQLVSAALTYARAHQLKVAPLCSYVKSYMDKHAEVQDLRA
jgi:uncharacterized protein